MGGREPVASIGGTEEDPAAFEGPFLQATPRGRAIPSLWFKENFGAGRGGNTAGVIAASIVHHPDPGDAGGEPFADGFGNAIGFVECGNNNRRVTQKRLWQKSVAW